MSAIKRGHKWWVDFMFDRIRYRKSSPENSRQGAAAYESVLRQKLARGESLTTPMKLPTVEPLTFQAFTRQWLENYVVNCKPSDIRSKKQILRNHLIPFWKNFELKDVSTLEIEKYKSFQSKQGKCNKSINNHLAVISKCLRTAQDWSMLDKLPKIKLLKVPPQKFDFLEPEEAELLLATATGIWREMILFVLHTGLRYGEMSGLTWNEIDLKKKTLVVRKSMVMNQLGSPKNNRIREIPLTDAVYQMLEQRKKTKNSEFVFAAKSGRHLKNENTLVSVHRICKQAGLRNIGWHTLRHTFASRLAANNNPLGAIQLLLGHSDIRMTMRYAHLSSLELKRAVVTLENPRP